MSWFSRTEDYSIENNFYGEQEITYGSDNDSSPVAPPSGEERGARDYVDEYRVLCSMQHTH